jgi:hypothetical protein
MITDDLATLVESIINDRLTVTTFDGYYEVDNAGEIARAALDAVLPMIRERVKQECGNVFDAMEAMRSSMVKIPSTVCDAPSPYTKEELKYFSEGWP